MPEETNKLLRDYGYNDWNVSKLETYIGRKISSCIPQPTESPRCILLHLHYYTPIEEQRIWIPLYTEKKLNALKDEHKSFLKMYDTENKHLCNLMILRDENTTIKIQLSRRDLLLLKQLAVNTIGSDIFGSEHIDTLMNFITQMGLSQKISLTTAISDDEKLRMLAISLL